MAGAHLAVTIEVGTGTYWVPGTWRDLSDRMLSWTVTGGFAQPWMPPLRWQPLRATVTLDNSDRALDPRSTTSTYYDSTLGGLNIRPGSPVRIKIDTIGLFYGQLDDLPPTDTRSPSTKVTITATDGTKALDRARVTPYAVAAGAGESVVDRLIRLAEAANWPAGMRSFDTEPDVTLQATTLEGSIWKQMQLTAESGGGYIFLDQATSPGALLYRARSYDATVSVARYWSNQNTATKGITTGIRQSSGLGEVRNQVRYQRVSGAEQLVEDTDSIDFLGIADLSRTDLICEDDTTVADLAAIALSVAPKARPQIIEFSADTAVGSWQNEMKYSRIGDRIELIEEQRDRSNTVIRTITQESFIRSAKWSGTRMTAAGLFHIKATFGIQPSWAWDALTVGSTTKGVLGQNVTLPTGYGTTFSGRQPFATNDVLEAAELNSLMDMRWQVFASATARDSAYSLVAPISGTHPIAILLDTGIVEVWDGSQWVPMAEV